MSGWQQVLKQKLTVSEILRTYGKQFKQISEMFSDGSNGRCAVGVLMSYFGWDGKEDLHAKARLSDVSIVLKHAGASNELVVRLNDAGFTFDEIADHLERYYELPNNVKHN